METVMDGIDEAAAIKGPDDLARTMKLTRITVRQPSRTKTNQLAELQYRAEFEEEHGVGVLTDGDAVLGLGYSGDVEPFKPE